jgi:hypothetical protein
MCYRWIEIGAAALLAAGAWHGRAGGESGDADLVRRGEYLVNEVAHCTHCHTPHGGNGGHDRARLLQGATLPIRPKEPTKNWADRAPDITRSGLAGKWSEDEMVKFLTTGEDTDGEKPAPPMPVFRLHKDDARAVTLYLRSLPGKGGGGGKGGGKGGD